MSTWTASPRMPMWPHGCHELVGVHIRQAGGDPRRRLLSRHELVAAEGHRSLRERLRAQKTSCEEEIQGGGCSAGMSSLPQKATGP
mmetsp:Transcript_59969/g.194416  ORF Transcript_59969/g.194416 Transcript_59969/m.194416 type:complete len:86 (-) Transcript_59969:87-344(-)